MKVKANFIYLIIIAFLIALLIIGHQIKYGGELGSTGD